MMKMIVLFALVAAVSCKTFFEEDFSGDWKSRWTKGTSKGSDAGNLVKAARGVRTDEDARFYHYSASFDEFSNKDSTLVFQFSVKHGQGIDCGGGYFKLLPKSTATDESFDGDSPYHIMFGPDICGSTKRTHAIITYKEKNHLIEKDISVESDKLTHVYTLIINADQTFKVLIDNEVKREGKLIDEWDFLGPKEINDPKVSKPEDWVDEPTIDDPEDKKPEGYDDIPAEIPDPDAEKPDDWDTDLDGEWTAPTIANPEYNGPWSPKRIENPDYKGVWEHPQIPNPDYKEDDSIYAFDSIAGIGLDIWQVKSGTSFSDILVTDDVKAAESAASEILKVQAEEKAKAEKEAEEAAAKAKAEAEAAAEEDGEDDDEDEDEHEDL